MVNSNKLKPINWIKIIVNSVLALVIFFSFFAIIRAAVTPIMADKISGVIYLVITIILLVSWLRTKLILIIPSMLMNLFIAVHFFTQIRIAIILINVILFLMMCYMLYVHFKYNSIHRKILELAAYTVSDTKNGFTLRSYPVGKTVFSQGELFGFAEYLKKHHIVVPCEETNAMVFILAEDWFGYLYDVHRGYEKVTRIVFRYDGSVTISIAKSDYSKYKETLTFDQLCASLGYLFIEFFEHFKKGDNTKIIDKIK
jgi:hypothetical protein